MYRILIVDDELDVLKSMVESFRMRGYETEGVDNKKEAIEFIHRNPPFDVAIIDMKLSWIDDEEGGLEVAKAVKEKDLSTEIIIVTAYGSLKNVYKVMSFGIFTYIDKHMKNYLEILHSDVEKALLKKEIRRKDYPSKKLDGILIRCLKEKDIIKKGKLLEEFTVELFDNIEGLSVKRQDVNIRTHDEEIDLFVRNKSDDKFWRQFESPIIVECKNWSKPVGAKDVAWFIKKLRDRGKKMGILISINGVTGNEYKDAFHQIIETRKTNCVILLEKKHLKLIIESSSPTDVIEEQYFELMKK